MTTTHVCDGRACLECTRRAALVKTAMTVDDRPDDVMRARVWAKLEDRITAAPAAMAWWQRRRVIGAVGALVASAAVVAVLAGRGGAGEGEGARQVLEAPALAMLDVPLGPHTQASLVGPARLEVVGVGEATAVRLERGTFYGEFAGGAGRSLRIEAPHAVVEIVGTLFAVEVEEARTCVSVAHGRVRVREGAEVRYVGGGERLCTAVPGVGPIEPRMRDALTQHATITAMRTPADRAPADDPAVGLADRAGAPATTPTPPTTSPPTTPPTPAIALAPIPSPVTRSSPVATAPPPTPAVATVPPPTSAPTPAVATRSPNPIETTSPPTSAPTPLATRSPSPVTTAPPPTSAPTPALATQDRSPAIAPADEPAYTPGTPEPARPPSPTPAPTPLDVELYRAAERALAQRDPDAADRALARLVAEVPASALVDQAHYERARIAYGRRAWGAARRHLDALAALPKTPLAEAGRYLGCRIAVEVKDGDAARCLRDYRAAYPRGPHDQDVLGLLAQLAYADGGCRAAQAAIGELVQRHATSALAKAWRARCTP